MDLDPSYIGKHTHNINKDLQSSSNSPQFNHSRLSLNFGASSAKYNSSSVEGCFMQVYHILCAEPMVQDLVKDFQEAVKRQERLVKAKDEFYMPFVAVPAEVINIIFKLSEHFTLTAEARYMAVHLYDTYLCNHFWKVYKDLGPNTSERIWQKTCCEVSDNANLYLMSCLQLASKMDSNTMNLDIQSILEGFRLLNERVGRTKETIASSEFTVFRVVDFRMPRYTPYHCLEILLEAIELKKTQEMRDVCLCLLDSAYLQREKLFFHLKSLISEQSTRKQLSRKKMMALEANYLFMAAGVILCGTFCLCLEEELTLRLAARLMNLVGVKSSDIWDFANILLMLSIQE